MLLTLLMLPLTFADPAPTPAVPPPVITVGKPAEPGKVPEVAGLPGRAVRLEAKAEGVVKWNTQAVGADLIPDRDGKGAIFVHPLPGRYLVFAVTAKGDVPSDLAPVAVVIGTPEPEPVPVPPRPVDPLAVALKAAFAADASPADPAKRKEALADLVEVYKQAPGFARAADLASVAAVIARVKAAATSLGLTATDLVGVRMAIGTELRAAFPADVPLDAAGREKLAAAFGRIYAALSAVTP